MKLNVRSYIFDVVSSDVRWALLMWIWEKEGLLEPFTIIIASFYVHTPTVVTLIGVLIQFCDTSFFCSNIVGKVSQFFFLDCHRLFRMCHLYICLLLQCFFINLYRFQNCIKNYNKCCFLE